ncbi:Replicase protein, partial [Pseudomonas savastanoi pv. glycinea]|uniref:replication protein A n=1 Tax=Pseudomonas savastanoi TaxID=29438 RepID=UPI000F00E7F6
KATESKIRAACRQLQDQGKALARSAIATLAGVSVRTVASYAHILKQVSRPATVSVLRGTPKAVPLQRQQDCSPANPPVQAPVTQPADGLASGVQSGVHQIPAVPQGPQAVEPLKTEHEDGSCIGIS